MSRVRATVKESKNISAVLFLFLLLFLSPKNIHAQSIDEVQFGRNYFGEVAEERIPVPKYPKPTPYVDTVKHPVVDPIPDDRSLLVKIGLPIVQGINRAKDWFSDRVNDIKNGAENILNAGKEKAEELGNTLGSLKDEVLSMVKSNEFKKAVKDADNSFLDTFFPGFNSQGMFKGGPKLDLNLFDIKLPEIHWPEIKLPKIKLPEIHLPRINLPNVKQYETPSFKDLLLGMIVPAGSVANLHWHEGAEGKVLDRKPEGFPDVPKQDPLDGSGQHAVKSFDLKDGFFEILLNGVAMFGETIGHTDAAFNMRHYLDNSGKPINIDPEIMIRDMPSFKTSIDNKFGDQVISAISKEVAVDLIPDSGIELHNIEGLKEGDRLRWYGFDPRLGSDPKWWWATNDFVYTFDGMVYTNNKNGETEVTVDYQLYIFDRYNWDGKQQKSVPIPGTELRLYDKDIGDLHSAGVAQEYNIYGVSKPQKYTFTLPNNKDVNLNIQVPDKSVNTRTDLNRPY